jgi:hypothetical protein
VLLLPFMHPAHPVPAGCGRWADPRVPGDTGVTQGLRVRAVLFDPYAYLAGSADGPVARDEDLDAARRALERIQRGEIVLDRVPFRSNNGIRTSDSMSPATRTPRSSINSAAWPGACA